jgi:hypothetical protein
MAPYSFKVLKVRNLFEVLGLEGLEEESVVWKEYQSKRYCTMIGVMRMMGKLKVDHRYCPWDGNLPTLILDLGESLVRRSVKTNSAKRSSRRSSSASTTSRSNDDEGPEIQGLNATQPLPQSTLQVRQTVWTSLHPSSERCSDQLGMTHKS